MKQEVNLPNRAKEIEAYLRLPYARIILPESDGTFRGEIMEFPGCIAVGDSAAATLAQLEVVAEGWLWAALDNGQFIPAPVENNNAFSGRLVLRLPKSLHKKATLVADREGVSLNQFITSSVSESVGEKSRSNTNAMFLSTFTSNYFSSAESGILGSTSIIGTGSTSRAGAITFAGPIAVLDSAGGADSSAKPMLITGRTNAGS